MVKTKSQTEDKISKAAITATALQLVGAIGLLFLFFTKAFRSDEQGLIEEEKFRQNLAYLLMVFFVLSAALLLSGIEAPYGRYSVDASWLYGVDIEGKPAWIIQECPNLFAVAWSLYHGNIKPTLESVNEYKYNIILISLFTHHYINRTLIYPLRMRGGKPSKFMTFIMALIFCSANGYLQMRPLTLIAIQADDFCKQFLIIVGVMLFIAGMYINTEADDILRNLRKPGDTGYKIPQGGMFEYVSGANFFGEIVEWSGFAIAGLASDNWLSSFCFAFCTAMNIGPRAIQHHNWYLKKFDKYPRSRKALIPFIL